MLTRTLLHMPGVSVAKEQKFWAQGVTDWTSALSSPLAEHAAKSLAAFESRDHRFFSQSLPLKEHWRAYPHFKSCFLDIETTGLSRQFHDITVIGLYDGEQFRAFVHGQDMDAFAEEIKKYQLIVTFNGAMFDVPFIKAKYPQIEFDHLHVDLRYVLRALGYSGGLKRIEHELGLVRDDEIQGMDGFAAVRLWWKAKKGDASALAKLIKYNEADVKNLKTLMEFAYEKMCAATLASTPELVPV